jgi:prepilin-type N-terminal cleavage/methylation domain-containing protein
MRNNKGFSLIELLLVVAVILIISAIAVPSYLRSRLRANEASAISTMRQIDTAAVTYASTYPDLGYPVLLSNLGGPAGCAGTSAQACMIDDTIAQGTKSGYAFVWTGDGVTPSVAFTLTATPQMVGSTGQAMYCTDQTSLIHIEISGAGCTNASPALQ